MHSFAMSKRERRGAMTRSITYQKVLLAVHVLSDEEGLACNATVARIASECGHSIVAVQRSIKMMIERGVVLVVGQWDGLNRRILVLADHPRAEAYIADVKAQVDAKWREESDRRVAKKQGRA
jgi:hypothetical protein